LCFISTASELTGPFPSPPKNTDESLSAAIRKSYFEELARELLSRANMQLTELDVFDSDIPDIESKEPRMSISIKNISSFVRSASNLSS